MIGLFCVVLVCVVYVLCGILLVCWFVGLLVCWFVVLLVCCLVCFVLLCCDWFCFVVVGFV